MMYRGQVVTFKVLSHFGRVKKTPSSSRLISTSAVTHISRRIMPLEKDNKKLFLGATQTKNYANFRPRYPEELYGMINEFCVQKSSVNDLAIDIGCGPGLSSIPLTRYFSKVIGLDVSQQQISNAPTDVPGLSFQVSSAEDVPFIESDSVDLVTVAQALHWLQLDKFFAEMDRILKSGGSLVTYGYGLMEVDNKEIHEYLRHIHDNVFGDHWNAGRSHIEDKYAKMELPYEGWQRNDNLVIERHWRVDEIVGYITSWSAFENFSKANPEADLAKEIHEKLSEIGPKDDGPDLKLRITWPIFVLMAHKPEN